MWKAATISNQLVTQLLSFRQNMIFARKCYKLAQFSCVISMVLNFFNIFCWSQSFPVLTSSYFLEGIKLIQKIWLAQLSRSSSFLGKDFIFISIFFLQIRMLSGSFQILKDTPFFHKSLSFDFWEGQISTYFFSPHYNH